MPIGVLPTPGGQLPGGFRAGVLPTPGGQLPGGFRASVSPFMEGLPEDWKVPNPSDAFVTAANQFLLAVTQWQTCQLGREAAALQIGAMRVAWFERVTGLTEPEREAMRRWTLAHWSDPSCAPGGPTPPIVSLPPGAPTVPGMPPSPVPTPPTMPPTTSSGFPLSGVEWFAWLTETVDIGGVRVPRWATVLGGLVVLIIVLSMLAR